MTPGITSSNSTPAIAPGQTPPAAPSAPNSVTKNMFMQLLVAQLKHQDPLNPADGTQFLTQLAQFQQLEQTTNSGEDLTAIRQDLDKLVAAVPSTTPVSKP